MKLLKLNFIIALIIVFGGGLTVSESRAAEYSVIRVGSEVEFPPLAEAEKNSHLIRLTESEKIWLNSHKTVRIAIPAVFPPLMFLTKNGRFQGIIPDYLNVFAKHTGITFEPVFASLSELPEQMKTRQTDMFPAFIDIQQDKFLNLTEPCFSLPWVIVNRIGGPFYRNERDLEGLKVSVVKNVPICSYLSAKYPGIELYTYDKPYEALKAVSEGITDVFVGALPVVGYSIQKNQIVNLKIAGASEAEDFLFRFAVRSDFSELTSILNKVIHALTQQEHDEIFHKQMPIRYQHTAEWKTVWQWVWGVGGIFGIFLGISLLWNRRLSKEVEMRKQAEAFLRESEERFRHLFVNIPSGVAVYEAENNGEDFIFRDFNTAGEKIEHIRREDVIGRKVSEVFPGVKNFGIFTILQRVWKSGQPEYFPDALYRNGRDSGTWRENWIYKLPNGEIVAIYNDITERKHAEKLLQVSLEKYKVLFGSFPVGVSVTDAHGNLIEVNRESERLLGVSVTEHSRRKIDGQEWKIIRADGTPMSADEYASVRALKTRQLIENVEMGIIKENREITWINVHAAPIPIEGFGVVITYHDITARKQAEYALRKNEERYRSFFGTIGYGVVYQDGDGKITDVNPAAEKILGLNADQMKGKTFSEFVWRIIREDGSEFASDEYPSAISLKTGRETREVIMGIFSISKADMIWVRVSSVPQFGAGENTPWQVYSVFEDITDKKLAENSRKWEIKSLRQYSEPRKSVITSEYLGVKPLRTALADMFEEFVGKYEEWMELAIEKELFKVDNDISVLMQTMAERLGFFNAGPRDLVDIHVKALQHKTEKLSSRKAQIYADAGRMMLLELMGYLLSFYRNRCVGITTIRGSSNGKKA